MKKVAVVTGGSSGIGLEICRALIKSDVCVYELSRREASQAGINHIFCDVTDEEAVSGAIDKIRSEWGRIDILINNAGFGISGAAEFTDNQSVKKLMEVNFFGVLNLIKKVVPIMRENGGGRIVNISSVAAVASIPFQSFYSVSKSAVNTLTLALSNEVKDFGISVCAVMPGDTRTGFTGARIKSTDGNGIYKNKIEQSVKKMEKDEQGGMSAEKAGEYIAKIALKKRVKPLYSIGFIYKLITVLIKILPAGAANFIVGILYA